VVAHLDAGLVRRAVRVDPADFDARPRIVAHRQDAQKRLAVSRHRPGQRHSGQTDRRAAALDFDAYDIAFVLCAEPRLQLHLRVNRLAVDFGEAIAGMDAGLVGRRPRLNGAYQGFRRVRVLPLNRDAEDAALEVGPAL
jgi:hypothetical protein